MEAAVFAVAATACLVGAVGVVASRNPVHSALMLVLTLFGVAVLFVAQEAQFLAAVQVIVYAGAIVVLFLFVIMLLGVDRAENLRVEPLAGQRPSAAVVAVASIGLLSVVAVRGVQVTVGAKSLTGPAEGGSRNVAALAEALFTDYVFAFEATSALLVIGVVGAVLMARRPPAGSVEAVAEDRRAGSREEAQADGR